jgi:7-carboxy-7-deazaguanine synthase
VSDAAPRVPHGELAVSEVFESVQGEGASAGEPCVFLRLAYCNLRCSWCDTKYTWDFTRFRFEDEVRFETLGDVAERLERFRSKRLVVTGGEPLLQAPALEQLFDVLAPTLAIELETNGTLAPSPRLLARVTQWNVSPKLAHGGDPATKRLRFEVLSALSPLPHAYLKLVVEGAHDLAEAEAVIAGSGWARERVLLMAQASSRVELRTRGALVESAARERGLRYSPRLHVERWDGARGK